MPRYLYECDTCGSPTDCVCPSDQIKVWKKCPACGKRATRRLGVSDTRPVTGWPLHCEAAAIHPEQLSEYAQFDEKMGVKTEYDGSGRPIFLSRGHRREYLKAHGIHDRDGGYGD